MNKEQILQLIQTNDATIIPEADFLKKLASGKKLKIKLGMDPTSPDLHLGHAVVLSKMKQFQDLGHEIIFLIGDFTARIGDPTGKSKTRPPLSEQEIKEHMHTYFTQVTRILDPLKMTVRYNSEWLDAMSIKDMVKLCGKVTLAKITEREDFANRIQNNQPIGLHELLYPLFQGFDSVELHADVELGGTDQTFNVLMGRFLQEQYGQEAQVVITTPLLRGLDGVHKMSKSLGNAIGLNEPANQAYGKLMSISDELMWHYFEVLLGTPRADVSVLQERVAGGTLHPMELKKDMAFHGIARFWSIEEAEKARENFVALFQKKDFSKAQEVALLASHASPCKILDLLKALGAVATSSEGRRLVEAGAVSIDEKTMTDLNVEIALAAGMIVRVGKHRIYKIS